MTERVRITSEVIAGPHDHRQPCRNDIDIDNDIDGDQRSQTMTHYAIANLRN